MVNPFLAATPERAKQIEAQEQERLRWGHAEYLRFTDWPAVAFDLDHTIARYRLPQLHKLCYDLVVAHLSKNEYSGIPFRPFGEMDMKFAQRGIYYDKQRGIVMKLDGNGDITQAYHGTTPMGKDELDDIYAGCQQLITLKHGPFIRPEGDSKIKPVIHCFNDHFMTGTIYLLMELVQLYIDGEKIHYGFERPFRHLLRAYDAIFDKKDFQAGREGFFSALREDPTRYLYRLTFQFTRFLKKLKSKKIATIIITNSAPDFANFVLNYTIGAEWKQYFDAVVYDAKKPYFFTYVERPYYWVHETTGRIGERADPKDFKAPMYVSQGSLRDMKNIIKAANGHLTHRILYVGDSLVDEICACGNLSSCAVIAVTEELREEIDSEWGSMLGTSENPTFWRRKLEKHAVALLFSIEALIEINPLADIRTSSQNIRVIRNGRIQEESS